LRSGFQGDEGVKMWVLRRTFWFGVRRNALGGPSEGVRS